VHEIPALSFERERAVTTPENTTVAFVLVKEIARAELIETPSRRRV
jgi:hypothetical protein